MHATDIVAYTYKAEILCPTCIVRAVDPHATDYYGGSVESWLDDVAFDMSIDRQDERSFDSEEFPKVAFADQIEAHEEWFHPEGDPAVDGYRWVSERCASCGEEIL